MKNHEEKVSAFASRGKGLGYIAPCMQISISILGLGLQAALHHVNSPWVQPALLTYRFNAHLSCLGVYAQVLSKKHDLNRKSVSELVCALCNTRQPVSDHCSTCGTAFGECSCKHSGRLASCVFSVHPYVNVSVQLGKHAMQCTRPLWLLQPYSLLAPLHGW